MLKTYRMKPPQSPFLNLAQIEKIVCNATNITPAELKAKRKFRRHTYAKILVIHHARRAGYSLGLLSLSLNITNAAVVRAQRNYFIRSYGDPDFRNFRDLVTINLYTI